MQPSEAKILADFLIGRLRTEVAVTARVIAAVPDDKASYKAHDTNMSAAELAQHLFAADPWFVDAVVTGQFSEYVASGQPKPSELASRYPEVMNQKLDQCASLSGEQLAREIQFHTFNLPAVEYLDFCLRHSIHHRGQLSVALRPMGAKVPSMYGGSADEPVQVAAAEG